jgi:UDP-N-acetyl-D-glucosamine dehydrogenase
VLIRGQRMIQSHSMKDQLLAKIHDHTAVVAIVGLGYVGLPLAVAFAERGFPVVGIDMDARKVAATKRGELCMHRARR